MRRVKCQITRQEETKPRREITTEMAGKDKRGCEANICAGKEHG